jgi:phenylacetic acid degradation protein
MTAPRDNASMATDLTVYSINGATPVVDPTAFVHPSAVLIGDVIVGAGCYIGPCASLRGDFGRIEIRAGANLQDCCVAHGFPGSDTIVGENGHIGHCAVLHSCIVERNALIGMNCVINDDAVIGESAIVAAMAFVKARMVVPPRTLAAGLPARVVRDLTEMELAWKIEATQGYQDLARRSLATMKATVALTSVEPDRKRIELPDIVPLSTLKAQREQR